MTEDDETSGAFGVVGVGLQRIILVMMVPGRIKKVTFRILFVIVCNGDSLEDHFA